VEKYAFPQMALCVVVSYEVKMFSGEKT